MSFGIAELPKDGSQAYSTCFVGRFVKGGDHLGFKQKNVQDKVKFSVN